jgi:hypothetical protein
MSDLPFYEPINLVKTIISDKEKMAKDLLQHLEEAIRTINGLNKAAPTVLTNESDANTRKMLNTTMNLVKRQQELNQILVSVVTMLLSSPDFTGWQAQLAMKLGGDGQAILREMMRQKLSGKA